MLDRLPNELFWVVTKQLADGDLKNLCEVSKYLHELTIPRLYESVTLFITERAVSRRRTCFLPSAYLKHTKHICFKAPIHDLLGNRCPHHEFPNLKAVMRFRLTKKPAAYKDYSETDMSFEFTSPLGFFLSSLTEHNLRTFKWELGICMPDDALGHNSDLIQNQRKIEHISLVTDGRCPAHLPMPVVRLGEFKAIRSLSWKGLSRTDDFESFRDCIKTNANGIENLVLDLLEWARAEDAYYDGLKRRGQTDFDFTVNFFARNVLSAFPGEARVILPRLSYLSLSDVSFQAATEEMQYALNITRLTTLKLRNCPYSLALLDTIVHGAQTIRLRSFELVIDMLVDLQGAREDKRDVSISKFLDSFQGLEDVYLMITNPIDWGLVSQSISRHVSTLDRLVTHGRHINHAHDKLDSPIPWCNDLKNLYHDAKLTCIGTCSMSSDLMRDWRDLSPKPTCKILHLRTGLLDDDGFVEPDEESDEEFDEEFDEESDEEPDEESDDDASTGDNREATLDEESSADRVRLKQEDSRFISIKLPPSTSASRPGSTPKSPPPSETSYGSERTRKIAAGKIECIENSHVTDRARWALHCARWAFGKKGLPNLQIFAYGDFSHEGRFASQSLLLCRDANASQTGGPAFRAITDTDYGLWDLIHKNMDMLAACAIDDLILDFG